MWETHVYNEGDMEDGAAVLDAIHLKYTTFMGSLDKIDRLAVLMSNLMLRHQFSKEHKIFLK